MNHSLKTLLIGFGLLAVVWAVLHQVDRSVKESKTANVENSRLGPRVSGEQLTDGRRPDGQRARKMSSVEAEELFSKIIIPSYSVEDVTLQEALVILNAKIAEQIPEGQPGPKVKLALGSLERQRRQREQLDRELAEALGASVNDLGSDQADIAELRVRNVPALVLLKYICDATKNSFFVYRGDFYLHGHWTHHSQRRFYVEEVLSRIQLEKVSLDRLGSEIQEVVSRHEYYGHKGGITLYMSENGREALRKGAASLPVIDLDLRHATLEEAVIEIAKQGGDSLYARNQGVLIFNPLNEREEPNPFDPVDPVDSNRPITSFDYVLDEDWDKPDVRVDANHLID